MAALIEKFTQDIADAKKALAETETGIFEGEPDSRGRRPSRTL